MLACLAVMVVTTAAPAAYAGEDPLLVSTYPAPDGAARSQDATELVATYDRDLSQNFSTFSLRAGPTQTSPLVPGESYLCGPIGELQGRKSICFEPDSLPLAPGVYRARTEVYPRVGTGSTVTVWLFTIDDTAPAAPVVSSPTGGVITAQPVVVTGTAEPGARVIVVEASATIADDRANTSGAFTVYLPYPPEDGVTHTFEVFAIDEAGNTSVGSGAITIYHDSVVQIPVIVTPTEGAMLNTTSVTVSGTAKAGSTVTVREGTTVIGTAPVNGSGVWSVAIGFGAGTHVITATSFDGVMTDGPSDARTFTIDLIAPAAPVIVTPGAGATVGTTNVVVSGTAEPNASVRVREGTVLRATAPVNGSGAWSATIPFTDGPHTITAAAVDPAGNLGPAASRSFSVDTAVPPVPVILTPAQGAFVNTSLVTVSGNAEPNVDLEIRKGTVAIGTATANGSGGWSVALSFADGAHTVTAVAIDDGGNASGESDPRSFTVDTVAPPAPVITQPAPGDTLASTTVQVRGTAQQSADIEVWEGATVIGTATADGEGNWSVTLTFTPGPHTIRARATDLAGNVGPYSPFTSFSVAVSVDTTAPAPPTIVDPAAGSTQQTTVIFRGSAEPNATVTIYEGATPIASGTASAGQYEFGTTMLAGAHTITATATDPAGNESLPSASRTFTVDGACPIVTILTPNGRVYLPFDPLLIDGTATDNNAVVAVELEIEDVSGETVVVAFADDCTGCPAGSVTWSSTPPLGPGTYQVTARAIDTAGYRSPPATIRIYVL